MRPKQSSVALLLWVFVAYALLACVAVCSQAAGLKLQVQLVWGTNDDRSPDPKHKPVEADVKAKLNELPLKFTNYFEVNRKDFEVTAPAISKVPLSEKCELEVKTLGGAKLEVSLFGKGKEVMKRSQPLAKGELLVLGGNAPNATAWLVVLKRIE
jgi:hypothetical protein